MSSTVKKNKSVFSTLFFIIFLDMIGLGMVIPIFAPLLLIHFNLFGLETLTAQTRLLILGFLIATYSIFQFFGAPILGNLSEKFGRKPLLLFSVFGSFIGFIISGFSIIYASLTWLFISRALDGFTGGNISIVRSVLADVSDPKDRAKHFALIGIAFGLAFIIGPLVGGILSDPQILPIFNYQFPFFFAAFLSLINLYFIGKNLPETLKEKQEDVSLNPFKNLLNTKEIFKFKLIFPMLSVIFLVGLGWNFFTQFFQAFLVAKFALLSSQIGYLFAYVGLWVVIVQGFITRRLSGKIEPKKVLIISLLILGLIFPILTIPKSIIGIYLIIPFLTLFFGVANPNLQAQLANITPKGKNGVVQGVNQSFQSLAMIFPPILAGILMGLNVNLAIITGGIIIILGWGIFAGMIHNKV